MAALLSGTSCSSGSDTDSLTVSFDSLRYQINLEVPAIEGQEKPALTIDIRLQSADEQVNPVLARLVNDYISDRLEVCGGNTTLSLAENIDNIINLHSQHYRVWIADGQLDNYSDDPDAAALWLSGEFKIEGAPLFNQPGLLSYGLFMYQYSGGPHGQSDYYYSSCLLNEEDNDEFPYNCLPVTLEMICEDDSLTSLASKIESQMASDYQMKSVEALHNEVLFENIEVAPTDNFYLSDNGVTWVYNVYEIAPYAAGTILVNLSWDELLPLIPAESPVLGLLNNQSNE